MIDPKENKIIVNMSLQRVDMDTMEPIMTSKKRWIRLKFQNRSENEYIVVKSEPAPEGIQDNDDSICTLQVEEKTMTKELEALKKRVRDDQDQIAEFNQENELLKK